MLNGEYGFENVCIGVPAILGRNGIEKIIELDLNEFEMDVFTKGITSVKEAIKSLQI